MNAYRKRISDELLQFHLESKGAVLVEGAKWCGKTTSASQVAKSILYMQDPKRVEQNLELARLNPEILLKGEVPRLIDEWQMAPKLWDAIRFEVDQRDDFGQFILTGSSTPADMSQIHHSGVGRFAKMLMRPMSLYESGDSTGEVSLQALFDGKPVVGISEMTIEPLAFLICRGGWPKALNGSERVALKQAIDYYQVTIENDISRVDGVNRSAQRADRVLRSYTRAIATQTTMESILQDICAEDTISIDTLNAYLDALKKTFVIEESLAWNPNLRSKTAIRTANTRYFTDPSIGVAALGLGPKDLINDLNTMGLFFENLCVRDLRVYAESFGGSVFHYRDKTGLECDAVIHLRNGNYGLIEIKLGGAHAIKEGAKTLNKLASKIDTDRMKEPAFKMILIGVGTYAYQREDGIFVVPIGCLRN